MAFEKLSYNITIELDNIKQITFHSSQEYYYILGQFVMYIFSTLGGSNNFKREINYLTNPNEPKSIYHLGKRNIKFISNYPKLVKNKHERATIVFNALIKSQHKFVNKSVNEIECSEAFYEGLYSTNFLVEYISK